MQAHPLSTTAALITLSTPSPQPRRLTANQLPPTLLLPAPAPRFTPPSIPRSIPFAAPHSGRVFHPSLPETGVAESAGLAHDAGNLLGALRLYCDLLSAPGVLRPEHRHYAADLSLIASRSSALIRRLLVQAPTPAQQTVQPDAAQQESSATPTDPATALRQLAPVLERIAAGVARVSVAAPPTLPASARNADLPSTEALERIAVNLVRNAAEAIRSSREGRPCDSLIGNIRVALEVTSAHLRLTVEDDGPGMPPAIAAAFLRPDPLPLGATRGLGHRIVHELATSTGALLSIRVRPGRGTTFSLRWPLATQPDDLRRSPNPNPAPHLGHDIALEPLHTTASPSTGAIS
jgi:nitrogen-specific signal transduction histidine kinase